MTGLVLGGGGTKGAYQVGALLAFKDQKIKFDGVVGTSIGSFNAAMYVSNQLDELYDFWLKEDLKKLLLLSDEDDVLKNIVKNKGIKLTLLQKRLKDLINESSLRNSNKDYGLVTVRLKDLKPLYLYKEDIDQGKLIEAITASCSLPIFSMEKLDNESYYLDGFIFDNVPYNMLLKKGYNNLYVIDLKSFGLKRKQIKETNLTFITPSRPLRPFYEMDKEYIKNNIKMGYYDTLKVLNKYDGFKYVFYKRNLSRYKKIFKYYKKEDLNKLMKKYKVTNEKDLLIKIVEKYLEKEKKDYNKIYHLFKELRRMKKIYKNLKYKKINIY